MTKSMTINEVNHGKMTPQHAWDWKNKGMTLKKDSTKAWHDMSVDAREATIEIVRHSLERMLDRMEDWVPSSLVVEPGKFIEVKLLMLFNDFDAEVKAMTALTGRKIVEAAEDTQRMIQEYEEAAEANG